LNIPPFKLERYFARHEFNVDYTLCSSDCEAVSVQDLLNLEPDARDGLGRLWLGYTESMGNPALRREICGIYQTMKPDQILVHTGAEEAIFLFMNAVLSPGDHVVVHWPCYQSLFEIARSIGCQVSFWRAREENNWALDVDELKLHIRSNTRAVAINMPHNPTGFLMNHHEFQRLNSVTQEYGILLFSDEVYRESEHAAEDRLPAACDMGENNVSLGVMSKTYGLAGLRIGWIASGNADIYNKMVALKDYTTICSSAPGEFLAALALRHRDILARRNLEIIAGNLEILDTFFRRHPDKFVWKRPNAGPIAFPRWIGPGSVDEFCGNLLTAASVLLLPGTVYDHDGNHFRIGFGRKNMPEAVDRLERFLTGMG
jgi:aspartate/methionine/tyrosine aminotransferase